MTLLPKGLSKGIDDRRKKLNSKYKASKARSIRPNVVLRRLGELDDGEFRSAAAELCDIAGSTRKFNILLDGVRFYAAVGEKGIVIPARRNPDLIALTGKLDSAFDMYAVENLTVSNPYVELVGNDIKDEYLMMAKVVYMGCTIRFLADSIALVRHSEDLNSTGPYRCVRYTLAL